MNMLVRASDTVRFVAVKALSPESSRPFKQRKRMLASRLVPLWGWHFAALNGMRKPGEPAWMLAKGAAGTGKVPYAPVRQADE